MPLFNKKPFEKNVLPSGLKDTEKVFYCEATNEIFDNYQEFAERIILCNSLVWACEETGKSGLTYVEALECERNAKKLLNDFPIELRRPVLYLVTLTSRSAISDVTDDVFSYVRERFFVGEILECNIAADSWINCRVLRVISPTSKEFTEPKNGIKPNEKQFWFPGSLCQYEVELLVSSDEFKKNSVVDVNSGQLRRRKSTYTRDRNHLFIKHFVSKTNGVWELKKSAVQRYEINKIRFSDIFTGYPPKFPRSDAPKKTAKKSASTTSTPVKSPTKSAASGSSKGKKQESIDKYLKPKTADKERKSSKSTSNVASTADKKSKVSASTSAGRSKPLGNKKAEKRKSTEEILEQELLEKRKKMIEHQQQLIEKKQQKHMDTLRKRDEKKKLEEFMKEWNKTREDLELEDLKELPIPVPVCLDTPNEYFGQMIMLFEFFNTFADQLNVKSFFPAGVTIDLLDRALSRSELAGPLFDFVHLLLAAIFRSQEEEEDEIGETYDSFAVNEFENLDVGSDGKMDSFSFSHPSSLSATQIEANAAAVALNWPLVFQGVPLHKLTIDATTVTEILRLHLLSSGSRVSETCNRWRMQEKGGFASSDDPGLAFRLSNPRIMRLLSEKCVAALSVEDKLSILECLVDQVVMFSGFRDIINENVENYRHKRAELRLALAAEVKKEKELTQRKKEKKQEKPGEEKKDGHLSHLDEHMIEKMEREIQKNKEDFKRQLANLTADNMKVQLGPVGTDRAYRRFWLFPSIPGIFVEDNEQNPPPCLARGTPKPNVSLMKEKDTLSYVRKLFQTEYNKENLGFISSTSSPKKRASVATLSADLTAKDEVARTEYTCWGDNEKCPVHSPARNRIKWSYYRTQTDFENLLSALNTRGKRESKLRSMLMQQKDIILKSMQRPFVSLNKSVSQEDESLNEIRKSSRGNPTYENAMFDFPADTDVETVLESLLRNVILDIEEKSSAGGLGCLRILDRCKWIEAITNGRYERSCEKLIWGPEAENQVAVNGGVNDAVVETKLNKDKKYANLDKFWVVNKYARNTNPQVKELAQAILQLEQSIELHYLKPPLGVEKIKFNNVGPTETLKRWEVSLMSATTFAQLFLHVCTLDNSIAWNRSALNANCRICRRRGDGENMLLCDMCNKGHHMYCLKPKLTKVPKGDWYCHFCKPPEKENGPVKKKYTYFAESDEDNAEKKNSIAVEKMDLSEKGKCILCHEKGVTIGCSKCLKRYHLGCLIPPLRKTPTINWSCHSCRRESAKKEENRTRSTNDDRSSITEPLRASRRRTSKSTNEKIYRFVRQLRRHNSSTDEDYADEEERIVVNGSRRRRTRHSAESNYVSQLPLDNASLQEMLNKIMRHEDAWPFLRPVSKYEAADYYSIIKRPMDFATIKHKLNMLQYHTNSQVINDSMLVFSNCFLYNKESSEVYQSGVRLMNYFKQLCVEMNFKQDLIDAENQAKRLNSEDQDQDMENEPTGEEEFENERNKVGENSHNRDSVYNNEDSADDDDDVVELLENNYSEDDEGVMGEEIVVEDEMEMDEEEVEECEEEEDPNDSDSDESED